MAHGLTGIVVGREVQERRSIPPTQLVWPMTLATLRPDSLPDQSFKARMLNYMPAINNFATQLTPDGVPCFNRRESDKLGFLPFRQ
jgi:hypothetical protein